MRRALHEPLWAAQRTLFWVCWVLWRITSPTGLVMVFLVLGTLAMAQRPVLHDWLANSMDQQHVAQGQLPLDPSPDLDRTIAAGVVMTSMVYYLLADLLLDIFHTLLHATTRQLRRRR